MNSRETIRVLPIHTWWTTNHRHGPGGQPHAPDTNDFYNDHDYLSWKYAGVLATTGGAFSLVTISANPQVSCGGDPAYACTSLSGYGGYTVVFGTLTFTGSENQAASIIGHELLHTTGANECAAYSWEFNHDTGTGILQCAAAYLTNVVQTMNCECNSICP